MTASSLFCRWSGPVDLIKLRPPAGTPPQTPQVEVFKYLGQHLQCCGLYTDLSLFTVIDRAVDLPVELYFNSFPTLRMRSNIQAAKIYFLRSVALHTVWSAVIWEGLRVESLLLLVERGQLRWLQHLVRILFLRMPSSRDFSDMSYLEEALGKTWDSPKRLYLLAGLGTPWYPSWSAGGGKGDIGLRISA